MTDRIDEDASREAFAEWYFREYRIAADLTNAMCATRLKAWQARGEYEAARIRSLLDSPETVEAVAKAIAADSQDIEMWEAYVDNAKAAIDTIKRIVEGE